MNDRTKAFAINSMECRKIKGHTRIELTKVATGEKKIIEHENTFQSAYLTAFLRSFGAANNNPFANSVFAERPLWRNLCGGIFLFRDEIQAPAEYMPAGNLMVANGAYGVTNNGTPAELGSYNSIESSTNGANSISFVYDWGTSQGNGTISCVCLTSENGGYVGYGNASGVNASLRNILTNQNTSRTGAHLYYNGKAIRIVDVDYTAKKITVAKGTDKITTASIFQGQNETTTQISYSGTPLGSGTSNIFVKAISSSEILIYKSSVADNILPGASFGLLIYNAATNTATVKTFTNNSGQRMILLSGGMLRVSKDTDDNYYFIDNSNNNIYQFDTNGSYSATFANVGGTSSTNGLITPELEYMTHGTSSPVFILNNGDIKPTNGTTGTNQIMHNTEIDALLETESSNISMATAGAALYKNPLYLATINNLDNAVTKDSTQTMKVIYTLTEASA